ncbi:MAG: hypothetical protein WAO98_01445 [Alphaproteobacteria bacterium]
MTVHFLDMPEAVLEITSRTIEFHHPVSVRDIGKQLATEDFQGNACSSQAITHLRLSLVRDPDFSDIPAFYLTASTPEIIPADEEDEVGVYYLGERFEGLDEVRSKPLSASVAFGAAVGSSDDIVCKRSRAFPAYVRIMNQKAEALRHLYQGVYDDFYPPYVVIKSAEDGKPLRLTMDGEVHPGVDQEARQRLVKKTGEAQESQRLKAG